MKQIKEKIEREKERQRERVRNSKGKREKGRDTDRKRERERDFVVEFLVCLSHEVAPITMQNEFPSVKRSKRERDLGE